MEGTMRECLLCTELYNDNINKPKVLACGHTFCEACLIKTLKLSQPCPMCQKEIREISVSRIPTNFALIPNNPTPKPKVTNNAQFAQKYDTHGGYPAQWNPYSNVATRSVPIVNAQQDRALQEERKQMQSFANTKVKEFSEFDETLEKSKQSLKKWCAYANDINLKSRSQLLEKIQKAKQFIDEVEKWCIEGSQSCIDYNIGIVNESISIIDTKRKAVLNCLGILQNVLRGINIDKNTLNSQLSQISTNEVPGVDVEFYTNVYESSWNYTIASPQSSLNKYKIKEFEVMSTTPKVVENFENYEWHTIDPKTGDRRQERYIEEQIELGYKNREPKRKIINKFGFVIATIDYANKTFILKKSKKLLTLQRVQV
ncbi:unnamed protein product [Blepharisma stoltei]|uniref:RING-type domain-containing protein n=1 Tax=Blepharisma stoltei TaxID=1481888 RepID=A0AAU9JP84_9CILI|nr:unnamed protein product [Blepharisma stoltei]